MRIIRTLYLKIKNWYNIDISEYVIVVDVFVYLLINYSTILKSVSPGVFFEHLWTFSEYIFMLKNVKHSVNI